VAITGMGAGWLEATTSSALGVASAAAGFLSVAQPPATPAAIAMAAKTLFTTRLLAGKQQEQSRSN
jgi:hypothetical protein